MPTIDISLFKPELVFFDFEANDRFDFFKKLGAELSKGNFIKDTWYDAITEREKNYPTGLAAPSVNFAVPHTDPEHLEKAYIAVVLPKKPIVFEAMGGMGNDVPAQIIMNLGVKQHEECQVAILQALMMIFLDEDAVSNILSQKTQQGMVDAIVSYCNEE